jgi:hypothetical protein
MKLTKPGQDGPQLISSVRLTGWVSAHGHDHDVADAR